MGLPHFISFLLDLVLVIFDVCALIVFVVWVVVRARREIRDIINADNTIERNHKELTTPSGAGRHEN
ncbi:MAG TPA: hypothetical protein VKR52_04515 [Terracidiphilus sp.]|nr:hypothetical protein [Terracidiphilus sp.]